jgi:titin
MRRVILAAGILLASAAPTWGAQNVLTWTDNSTNEQTFNIERKAEACAGALPFTPLQSVGANVTTFTDTTVTEGLTYCYRVNASNTAGASAWSNTAARTVPFTVPTAPSGLLVN